MTERSRAEQERQAAKTRKRLELAAAAALLLLRKRRNAIVSQGVAAGLPIPFIAHKLRTGLPLSIAEARTYSRDAGVKRLQSEAISADLKLILKRESTRMGAARDLLRARKAAEVYADRWEKKAIEAADSAVTSGDSSSTESIAEEATAETQGTLRSIAVTESSESFNEGRLAAVRESGAVDLYRRWDAQADACEVCAAQDGIVVGVDEDFPEGEPGSVHRNCCCSFELITAEEAGEKPTESDDEAA